jgi:hypothetical protein
MRVFTQPMFLTKRIGYDSRHIVVVPFALSSPTGIALLAKHTDLTRCVGKFLKRNHSVFGGLDSLG